MIQGRTFIVAMREQPGAFQKSPEQRGKEADCPRSRPSLRSRENRREELEKRIAREAGGRVGLKNNAGFKESGKGGEVEQPGS